MEAGSLAIICGLVGAATLDKLNRLRVCMASDLVSALSVAPLPIVDEIRGLMFGWFVVLGLLGAVGDVDAHWAAGVCSCAAALVTASLSREVGVVAVSAAESTEVVASHERAIKRMARASRSILVDGLHALSGTDALLRASTSPPFGISVVMGSWQGIVLPAHFTAMGIVGLFAGPASALLGFFAYDRVPESRRGAAMGTLNALFLVVAPAGAFFGSVFVSLMDIGSTCLVMTGSWIVVTLFALVDRALRDLDAPVPTE